MKHAKLFFLTALAASLLAACGAPAANNTPANNANAKPASAAPTAAALLDLDKKANEAYFKGDAKYFEDFLNDKFVMPGDKARYDKAAAMKMIGGVKCDVKDGWTLDDPQMSKIDDTTYVLSYKGTFDGTCTFEGKSNKIPSPVRGATVFVKNGDKWQAAYHNEVPIVTPPADDKKADAKADDTAKADDKKADDTAKADDKKADTMAKTDDKSAADAKSDDKKVDAKSDDKTAAADEKAVEPAKPDANTDALMKIHQSGWEAWKAKDAKKLSDMSTANLSIVNPLGMWMSGRDNVVKAWTETMKCEGVNNVKLSDGFASAISPTVEVLTLTGTADGTCDGQKNGPLHQTAVYVKEGNDWKLAFMFEAPAM